MLSYEVVGISNGDVRKTVARMRCYYCPTTIERTLNGNHNPDMVVKDFRRQGWKADKQAKRGCVCPTCIEKRRNLTRRTHKDTPAIAQVWPHRVPNIRIEDTPIEKIEGAETTQPETTTMTNHARDLTPTEKSKVRALLDQHFDEGRGAFLHAYSDHKIGVEVNVPSACVTHLREAAFGPLREDPAITAMRGELEDLENMVADFRKRFDALAGAKPSSAKAA